LGDDDLDIDVMYNILADKINKENISINEPMNTRTTFKIGGTADIFVKVKTTDELKFVLQCATNNNVPLTIIGNGSNVLVKDEGIRGIVVKPEFKEIEITEKEDFSEVTLGAGVSLIEISLKLSKEGYEGLEFACGIPGTIGGAVRMNAGAYGGEIKECVLNSRVMDRKGNIIELEGEEHKFEYRDSVVRKKDYIVLSTTLKLHKGNIEEIQRKIEENQRQRKEKQPWNMPSAGSVFKRNLNNPTSKMIDECGLKGYRVGDAEVSEIHAGFIVNTGNAKAKDVLELIQEIQKKVWDKFAINIELELQVL
jgi:UDP-N-acetylmuramate dehydrogenase